MIITPQALRGIYVAFNTIFNKADQHIVAQGGVALAGVLAGASPTMKEYSPTHSKPWRA